jgi:hypothetical protein
MKKVRQRTTARRIKLPLLHSCPGGVRKSSIHSPWRKFKFNHLPRAIANVVNAEVGTTNDHNASRRNKEAGQATVIGDPVLPPSFVLRHFSRLCVDSELRFCLHRARETTVPAGAGHSALFLHDFGHST